MVYASSPLYQRHRRCCAARGQKTRTLETSRGSAPLLPHTPSRPYHASFRQARPGPQVLHRLRGIQSTPVLAECPGPQLTILGDEQHAVEGDLWVVIDSYVFVSLPGSDRTLLAGLELIDCPSAGVRRVAPRLASSFLVPFAYLSLLSPSLSKFVDMHPVSSIPFNTSRTCAHASRMDREEPTFSSTKKSPARTAPTSSSDYTSLTSSPSV